MRLNIMGHLKTINFPFETNANINGIKVCQY